MIPKLKKLLAANISQVELRNAELLLIALGLIVFSSKFKLAISVFSIFRSDFFLFLSLSCLRSRAEIFGKTHIVLA